MPRARRTASVPHSYPTGFCVAARHGVRADIPTPPHPLRHSQWRLDPDEPELKHFEEAYTSSNKMVRIYKVSDVSEESKSWRAQKGVECASMECYPPALAPTLALKQSFRQIHGLA